MLQGKKIRFALLFLIILCSLSPVAGSCSGSRFKVLVVMSYEQEFPWVKSIRNGIQETLGESCEVKYFYMDTKKNIAGGVQKAKEAYDLFLRWRPDGVIAADDNAQTMFVLPYLKDKVSTPVMFCGVNAEPELYGYPCSNVSGILERLHIRESISFAQQLVPVDSVCFMMKDSPVAALISDQINREKDSYMITTLGISLPKTFDEAITTVKKLRRNCDLLFIENMEGITGADGTPMSSRDVIPAVVETFGKPTAGTDMYSVGYGVLCSVIKSGEEQGETAAGMLLQAMNGTAVEDIPVTSSFRGKQLLNITSMLDLGIRPRPGVLRGTQIVVTRD